MIIEPTKNEELLLSDEAYIHIEHWILRALNDPPAALLLCYLRRQYSYYYKEGKLTSDGYFFQTHVDIMNDIALAPAVQQRVINSLVEKGLISVSVRGRPPKRFFKLNAGAIMGLKLGHIKEIPAQKVFDKDLKQAEFYSNLNNALKDFSLSVARAAYSNIPLPVGDFMYGWTQGISLLTPDAFVWSGKDYGQLKRYFIAMHYDLKGFDYDRLRGFFSHCSYNSIEHPSLFNFIDFDKMVSDRARSEYWGIEDFIKELEKRKGI